MDGSCQSCNSERLAQIGGKVSDLGHHVIPHLDIDKDGYMPEVPDVCGGDYIDFVVCLECGQVQGDFPIMDAVFKADDDEDFDEDFGDDWE